jgi:ADP-ribose pyrophosphatase
MVVLPCAAVSGESRHPGRIRRELLWQGSVGAFGIDLVRLPNGNEARLALLEHPGAAAVVAFADRDSVLLLRQFRYAAGGTIWEVPAGKLDGGEDPADCARRELLEETGMSAGRLERTGEIWTTPGFTDERIVLFAAWDLVPGETAHEAHELISVERVALREALAMIDRGEIRDAKTIAALYHAARRSGALS